MNTTVTSLASRVLKTELVEWKSFIFIQSDGFKDLPEDIFAKLKASIISNQFTQPFYVWQFQNNLYCLDGYHRCKVLQHLVDHELADVPDKLPATFIECENEQDAAKLVLLYSSLYAKISHDGLIDFMEEFKLNHDEMMQMVELPDCEIDQEIPMPESFTAEPKDKPATLKITFENTKSLERSLPLIDKFLKENIPTAFFSVSNGEI